MNKEIYLKFGQQESSIAGNPYGESVFDEQIKDKMDFSVHTTIIFPNQIDDIAISFIQGFFKNMIEQVGTETCRKQITIKAGKEELVQKIWDNID